MRSPKAPRKPLRDCPECRGIPAARGLDHVALGVEIACGACGRPLDAFATGADLKKPSPVPS